MYDIDIPLKRLDYRKRISCLQILSESILCCASNIFVLDFSAKSPAHLEMFESITPTEEEEDEDDEDSSGMEQGNRRTCIVS